MQIYQMIDVWWIAQLPQSETAVAGVTVFNNIMWFFAAINAMVGSGSVAVISRRYGEKNYFGAETSIKETFLLKFLSGLVFTLVAGFYLRDMMYLAGARGEALELGRSFGIIITIGMPFAFMAFTVWTALRGVANPHAAMFIMIGSAVWNLVLDPILMFGYFGLPAMGIQGAAVATVSAYVMVNIVGFALLGSGRTNVRVHWLSWRGVSGTSMWRMMSIGAPAWIGQASSSGARLALFPLLAAYGDKVIAAYGIGFQAASMASAIIAGIGLGVGALLGHTLGAGKRDRARKTGQRALEISIIIMTALGIITFFVAPWYAELYFDDPETLARTTEILRVFAVAFPFWGVWVMLENIFGGVGMNGPGMVANVLHGWVALFPLVYMLTQVFQAGPVALWMAMAGIAAVISFGFWLYYRRGVWLDVRV